MRTIIAPTKIPITTHKRRPKIEVGFESSLFTNAPSYTDILAGAYMHTRMPMVLFVYRDDKLMKWGYFSDWG